MMQCTNRQYGQKVSLGPDRTGISSPTVEQPLSVLPITHDHYMYMVLVCIISLVEPDLLPVD